jgi:adenylylsulfate kinase
MVIWLTGLSGSGKSTLGHLIYSLWKKQDAATVMVDGDEVREFLGLDRSDEMYTLEGRRMVAERIHRICAWLDSQEINVVCSTISLFGEIHEMNEKAFSSYFDIFIDVPMETLLKRDIKNLYAPALAGKINNVMGVDLPFSSPDNPDYLFDNSAERQDLENVAADILSRALASTT